MTLKQTIRLIETVASNQPSVNMIVENDVFRLNSYADARYGVFAFTQGQHSTTADDNFLQVQLTLFYVDRLNSTRSNQIEVQSVGIETLDNIVRRLDDIGISTVGGYTFTTFNQRFLDECAGAFCTASFLVPAGGLCPESFGDFNDDFNDDFLIY